MAHVAIMDLVGYDDTDGVRRWVGRGELIENAAAGEVKRLSDKDTFPPFGAAAEKGSKFADALSTAVPTDQDPAAVNARLLALAGDEPMLVDPAGDPVDEAKTGSAFSPFASDAPAAKTAKSKSSKKG